MARANHRTVICNARTRPIRSDSAPPSQPPRAEVTSVTATDQPGLAVADVPSRDQRRDDEAEHLHVERVERPSAKAGPERPPLNRRDLAIPPKHEPSSLPNCSYTQRLFIYITGVSCTDFRLFVANSVKLSGYRPGSGRSSPMPCERRHSTGLAVEAEASRSIRTTGAPPRPRAAASRARNGRFHHQHLFRARDDLAAQAFIGRDRATGRSRLRSPSEPGEASMRQPDLLQQERRIPKQAKP